MHGDGPVCGSETADVYTVSETTTSTGTAALTITPGVLDHFTFSAVGSVIAGTPFNVDVTAWDRHGNIKTDYTGSPTLATTMNGSLIGCAGPCPASAGAMSTSSMVWPPSRAPSATRRSPGRTITVTDGVANVDDAVTFTVNPANLAVFKWTPISTPQTANATFSIEAKAYDAYDNLKTNYNASPTLSTLAASPNGMAATFGNTLVFASGVGSASAKAFKASAYAAGAYTADVDVPR